MEQSNFKHWLALTENQGKDFNFFKALILGRMNLDHKNGLSLTLDAWEPENLINLLGGLGEYKSLPQETQNAVEAKIQSRSGTLGDIIRLMATPPNLGVL